MSDDIYDVTLALTRDVYDLRAQLAAAEKWAEEETDAHEHTGAQRNAYREKLAASEARNAQLVGLLQLAHDAHDCLECVGMRPEDVSKPCVLRLLAAALRGE